MFLQKITKEQINILPSGAFNGTSFIIQNDADFEQVFQSLKNEPILGFDTETKPSFRKGKKNKVALIQLATHDRAYLIRTHNGPLPEKLIQLFENDNILKVGVAIQDDVIGIRHRHPFKPAGFIELQHFVKDYDIEDNGLKKLAANILGIKISKRQQLSNWEADELTEGQIIYAATDAWVCYQIYNTLINTENNQQL